MSRVVTIATATLLQDEAARDREVIYQRALEAVAEAGERGADLVVLPEEIDCAATRTSEERDFGHQIPGGPVYQRFADAARTGNINVVVGLRQRADDGKLYNVAVVIDRAGEYVGKYVKTHLAPSECDEVTAGDSYPVFELDFGKIGAMICMDIHYPEIWRILALQGADIIVHPTWWRDYTGDFCECLVNARAIDNQVYIVTSHFVSMPFLTGTYMGHSRIVDPYGRTVASTSHKPGLAIARVDLDMSYEFWATGDLKKQYPTLKECFFAMRRPETYDILTRPDEENSWKISDPTLFASE